MPPTNPAQKPPARRCPQHFCVSWHDQGGLSAPGTYASPEDARAHLRPAEQAGCTCSFDRCSRDATDPGPADLYEPCEPALEAARLPWFYFIPGPALLMPEFRAEYIAQSEALWGARHWERDETEAPEEAPHL